MIILSQTTDNLQVVLAGAITTNQLQCFASYRDIGATDYTPGRNVTNTNDTTDVNLVPSPAASTQRVVDFFSIYNNDTVVANITIKFDANGTEYILYKTDLNSGSTLIYQEGSGFTILSNQVFGYTLAVHALTSSPADGVTAYFGNLLKAPTSNDDISNVVIPKTGVIKAVNIWCYSGTAGSNEDWSLYLRLNNTTDYLIATLGVATNARQFYNNAMNIPVIVGDYFEIKGVQPAWGTNPLTTIYGGYVYIE